MPALNFSGSVMAVVAYGEVEEDGTSPNQNSGQYKTSKLGPGHYLLTPNTVNDAQTENLSQCIVQVKAQNVAPVEGAFATVFTDSTPGLNFGKIHIFTWDVGDPSASSTNEKFSFVVLRSTLTPPAGSPA